MNAATIATAGTIMALISGVMKIGNSFVKFFSRIFAKKKNVVFLGSDRYGDKFYMINGKVENVTSFQENNNVANYKFRGL